MHKDILSVFAIEQISSNNALINSHRSAATLFASFLQNFANFLRNVVNSRIKCDVLHDLYYLLNLKNVKNIHEGVLLLGSCRLQLQLQMVPNCATHHTCLARHLDAHEQI